MINIRTSRKSLITTVFLHFLIIAALFVRWLFLANPIGWLPFQINLELCFQIEKWFVWIIPALILIKVFEKEIYISLNDMFTRKVKLKTFLWCFLPVVLYLVGKLILAKYFGINFNVAQVNQFSSIQECAVNFAKNSGRILVTAAIPEEILFRAWILNALLGNTPTRKQKMIAIILSNILFAAMHWPFYVFQLGYSLVAISVFTFVLGSVFSMMFLKSKNIILPIFIHCFWDAFTATFLN